MPIKPWRVLESTRLRPRIRIDKCELPNGKIFEPMVFEFRTWANVLALTADRRAVLIRQYRHGIGEVMWEFPGGIIEQDESPLEGVRRELLEETGYGSGRFIEVGRLYPNPAIQSNRMHSYLALDVEEVTGQNLDEGEDIEVHLLPLDELIRMAAEGEFPHALMAATLFQALAHLRRVH
jgi:8-oxo-dGTP pyrophosphatase MutT (NUDIX family)